MKKTTLTIIFAFLIINLINAQQTYVPDDNFENYLETHNNWGGVVPVGDPNSMGNGIANDDYVLTSRISDITTLQVENQNIGDLTGIEDFAALNTLWCYGNQLTDLDVTQNSALLMLLCENNQLTSLDVSQNTSLQTLLCSHNQLTNIDIIQNTNLQSLDCYNNQLSTLDITQNTNLQSLNCYNNQLSTLDITQNTVLKDINCSNNQLTTLDVSQNTALQKLYCSYNQIATLNITQNTALQYFECFHNQLTALDMQNGNNTNLTYFNAIVNPDLTCVFVDDATFMNTNHTNSIDATATYVENQSQCDATMQTTYVPDDNFENYLETHDANGHSVAVGNGNSMGNGIVNDDFVLTHRISNVINLYIYNQNIADLTGIEDFTALQNLSCSINQLSTIDVSHNTALQNLYCSRNQLTSLDVSLNTALQTLSCNNNSLTTLDVTQNTVLDDLNCSNNQLTSLEIQNGNNTNFTNFDATGNPDLTCVFVDDASYMNTNWSNAIDATANYVENQAQCDATTQTTYIPDDNFENYLETHDANGHPVAVGDGNSMGNGIANDNYVYTSRINTVTYLYIYGQNIADLTGIEDFTALQILDCSNNQITAFDITHNTALQELTCFNNQLFDIDITQNTAIHKLVCNDNQLTGLDMRNGNNTNLTNFRTTGNPNLICVYVDDANYMNTNWSNAIDGMETYVENQTECNIASQTTYVPDDNFENYLETHNANGGTVAIGNANSMGNGIANDDTVLTRNISNVTSLDVYNQNIADLTGIEDFTSLEWLGCNNNQLTSLNVTQNTTLQRLYCSNNQLTSLDVSQNTALQRLYCTNNQLATLDVSPNTVLQYFECNNNQLTALYMQNGNNTNLTYFYATGNPNLTCVFVDDASYMNTNHASGIDETATYVETQAECDALNFTYVPDDNFENYLETHDANGNTVAIGDANSMGNGIANDDYVLTSKINSITNLNVNNLNIADLTGIEDFAALQDLYCSGNQLTSLDVTQNTNLQTLYCNNNQLTALDVSQNTALQRLSCSNNQLTAIDVTQNINLRSFYCYANQITSLDVSQNTSLIEFVCYTNQLTNLDMRNAHNNNLITFTAIVNPDLTCVFVDNKNYMNTNWSNAIDATATYVETQAECDALGIKESFKENIFVYPNPFRDYLSIQVPDKTNIKSISVQNMQGQIIYKSGLKPQIKLSNLPTGIYFLSIENKTGTKAIFKLMKN